VLRLLAPLGLFVFAFLVRSLPYRQVLLEHYVVPFGNDAYYHLRRIAYSTVRFPDVLDFDPYINFPKGAKPIWSPLFDWLIALLALPFYRSGESLAIERLVVWVPPALGAATVVATWGLARRYLDEATALLAGLFLSVLSAHFWYSQIGFLDHHAAVALAATWMLAATMALLDRDAREPQRGGRLRVLAAGSSLGVALLLWPGSLLYVALAEAGLLLYLVSLPSAEAFRRFAWRFAAVQVVALAWVLPPGLRSHWPQWGSLSPVVLSHFQPWLFATLALLGALCAALPRRALFAARTHRAAGAALLGLVLLALSALLLPDLWAGVEDAWRWLAKAESFQARVAESQPLFAASRRAGWAGALARLSGFVLVFPMAALAAASWAWRRSDRAALLFWIGWSLTLFSVTLVQRRFFNTFSVAMALVMAWCVREGWRYIAERAPGGRPGRVAARALWVGVVLAMLAPLYPTYAPHLGERRWDQREVRSWIQRRVRQLELAHWIERSTPRTQGWLDASERPEYGVLAPWFLGHLIEYAGRRPTVTDNFGDDLGPENFELARRYYRSSEDEASKILGQLRVRYVVAPRRANFLGDPPPSEGSMFVALNGFDGSEADPPLPDDPPALRHHRLVYETGGTDGPAFKLFQHVAGARIWGLAAPGARIALSLPLRTGRGRELVYRAHARVGEDGRYEIRVPYATQQGPEGVTALSSYTLRCGDDTVTVPVPEWKVQRGVPVKARNLCR